jgi:hypothetical protein
MFVVMAVVSGVPMPVVHVVDVVGVRDRHVTASVAVRVVVRIVLGVAGRFALVEVAVVFAVQVAVVDVVDVIAVRHPDVPTALAVDVGVLDVLKVARCHGVRLLRRTVRRVLGRPAG